MDVRLLTSVQLTLTFILTHSTEDPSFGARHNTVPVFVCFFFNKVIIILEANFHFVVPLKQLYTVPIDLQYENLMRAYRDLFLEASILKRTFLKGFW